MFIQIKRMARNVCRQPCFMAICTSFLSLCCAPVVAQEQMSVDAAGISLKDAVSASKQITITETQESTDKDTGALVVDGGVGVEKDLNVGGDLNVSKKIAVTGTVTKQDVGAFCRITPPQTVNVGHRLNFNDVVADTHGAVTVGSNWKYTAPETGWYRLTVATHLQVQSHSYIELYKNGALFARVAQGWDQYMITGSIDVPLSATDEVYLMQKGDSGSIHTSTSAKINWISIVKN